MSFSKNPCFTSTHSNASSGLLDVMEESHRYEREPDTEARMKLKRPDYTQLSENKFFQSIEVKKKTEEPIINDESLPILISGFQRNWGDVPCEN